MRWLWLVGPLSVLFVYLLLLLFPTERQRDYRSLIKAWIEDVLGPLKMGGKLRGRRIKQLAPRFEAAVEEAGSGARITDVVLVPKLAYMAFRDADFSSGSVQQSIVMQLDDKAPTLTVRPLVVIDGRAVDNDGLDLGDEDFVDLFVTEGADADFDAISAWLDDDLRAALSDTPDVWLRTKGTLATLTLYGQADAESLDEFVGVADTIFAVYGADANASLFGEGASSEASPKDGEKTVSLGYRSHRRAAEGSTEAEPSPEALPAPSTSVRLMAGAVDVALYAVGIVFVAAVLGQFDSYHPSWMFKSPDLNTTESWQGGWTTKGVGALVAAETLLVGLLVGQSYGLSNHGQSLGHRLFGVRLVRLDGRPMNFFVACCRRDWALGALVLLVVALTPPVLSLRNVLLQVPTMLTLGLAVGGILLVSLPVVLGSERNLFDRLSGTRAVRCAPWRLPQLQIMAESETDPLVRSRVLVICALMVGWTAVYFFVERNFSIFG